MKNELLIFSAAFLGLVGCQTNQHRQVAMTEYGFTYDLTAPPYASDVGVSGRSVYQEQAASGRPILYSSGSARADEPLAGGSLVGFGGQPGNPSAAGGVVVEGRPLLEGAGATSTTTLINTTNAAAPVNGGTTFVPAIVPADAGFVPGTNVFFATNNISIQNTNGFVAGGSTNFNGSATNNFAGSTTNNFNSSSATNQVTQSGTNGIMNEAAGAQNRSTSSDNTAVGTTPALQQQPQMRQPVIQTRPQTNAVTAPNTGVNATSGNTTTGGQSTSGSGTGTAGAGSGTQPSAPPSGTSFNSGNGSGTSGTATAPQGSQATSGSGTGAAPAPQPRQ